MTTRPPMFAIDGADLSRGYGLADAVKDLSGQWYATMGIDRQDGGLNLATTPDSFAALAAQEPWVYAVINRVMMDAQRVPLVVWAKKGKGLVRPEENAKDARQADIQYLVDNVNSHSMSGSDLKAWHVLSEYIWGEDYWLKVRGRMGGAVQELHWLRPANITPVITGSWITTYRYTGTGQTVGAPSTMTEYKAGDVIAYRTPNPMDPSHGLSFLNAVRYDISVDRQAAMWTAYTLANWGIPAGAWVAPKGADLAEEDISGIRRVLRRMRGPKQAGKTAVLPEGLQWQSMAINPKDAEWLNARKVSRMTICAAAGVPLVLVGDDDKNTVYGNLRDAERVYWRGTLIPKLNRWADTLNFGAPVSLLDEFGKDARDAYVIGFDYSEVEALRPEQTAEMNAWTGLMASEVVTPNEARRHFNIGPDVKWGDDPLRSTRLISEPPDELPSGSPQVEIGKVSVIPTTEAGIAASGAEPPTPPTPPAPATPPEAVAKPAPPTAPAKSRDDQFHEALAVGLKRRYSVDQLLNGVPNEGFRGLKEIDHD